MFVGSLGQSSVTMTQIGSWQHMVSTVPYRLSELQVAEIIDHIKAYLKCYDDLRFSPLESTWIRERYGIPCFWLRLDVVPMAGQMIVYEIEDRSSGMADAPTYNSQMSAILESVSELWPRFVSVQSPRHSGSDDGLRWGVMTLEEFTARSDRSLLALPRCEPHEEAFHQLANVSVGPIRSEGDKSYGPLLGLWREVTALDAIDFTRAWAIKRVQGSKLQGVKLFKPGRSRDRPNGCVSAQQAAAFAQNCIELHGLVYVQPLVDPPECALGRFMLRPFVLFDPVCEQWVLAGGEWLAMDNYRLHGTSQTVFGPLVLPEGKEDGIWFRGS